MCNKGDDCCNKLEAEAIHTNQQLLDFNLRSKDIQWQKYVIPMKPRSNPVFLQRQFNIISNYREPIGNHNRRKVLVCHDMMGNYLEDRHYHTSKKYDDYRFYHWPGIDFFCYFSHNYITIPPCGWINAAHKHGVPVLGTFITEGSKGIELLNEVLVSTEYIDKIVASMVKLCKHFNFDGWLVNIECNVDPGSMNHLVYFVERLREVVEIDLEFGSVFWYDSIIEGGHLSWQNEINDKNMRFFKTVNGTLVNYRWNDRSLQVTRTVCEQEHEPLENVYFGIDVFGRGQTAKFQCKQTLARIVQQRFSTGIFAPGWTYETLEQYGFNIKQPLGDDMVNEAFLMRNEKFWWLLWEHLATHPYVELPFYTDFCLGSGKRTYGCGLPKSATATPPAPSTSATASADTIENIEGKFFNLSRQSLQPSVPLHDIATRYYDDAFNGGSCLRIHKFNHSFRLFVCDFQVPYGGLVFAYAFRLEPRDGDLDLVLRFCTNNNARDCYIFLGEYHGKINLQRGRCHLSPFNPKYNELLRGDLDCQQIPKDMAKRDYQLNGWRVRYYVMYFNSPINIKDIGVLYRKPADAKDTAYLGAVYINDFNNTQHTFPSDSNVLVIPSSGRDIFN